MLYFKNLENRKRREEMANFFTEKLKEGLFFEDAVVYAYVAQYINPEAGFPIPEKFKPYRGHLDDLREARERFAEAWEWDEDEAEKEAERDYQRELKWFKKGSAERQALKKKYDDAMERLEAWWPPNKQGEKLKILLVDCIKRSLGLDCSELEEPTRKSGEEYKEECIKQARRDMEYHGREHQEEIVFARLKNRRLKEIRESIRASETVEVISK